MKGEIDRDFYCSAGSYTQPEGICKFSNGTGIGFSYGKCRGKNCPYYHRKYPTPEQYKEEYGEEYEGHRPVWWKFADCNGIWRTKSYDAARGVQRQLLKGEEPRGVLIVCACMPWDGPDQDWRP